MMCTTVVGEVNVFVKCETCALNKLVFLLWDGTCGGFSWLAYLITQDRIYVLQPDSYHPQIQQAYISLKIVLLTRVILHTMTVEGKDMKCSEQ